MQYIQFPFDGQWMPDADAAKIGPRNFKSLINMRYVPGSIEGIQGYTETNTGAISSYTDIRNGHQLRTDRTNESYVLVQAYSDATNSKVYYNTTSIPNQGDYTALHTDASGHGLGRFATAPQGNIAYANGVESYIWAGDEMRVSGFFTMDDDDFDGAENPIERTDAINNTLSSTNNYISIGAQKFWTVFSTRPLQGVKYTIKTANPSTSTLAVAKYWSGSAWTEVSNPNDGTTAGGKTLAQTGVYSFDATTAVAKPFHYQGLYLYGYLFELSTGTAEVSYVTVDAPWQSIVDVWDGVFRQPIQFQFSFSSAYEDYTLEVNEPSDVVDPIAAELDGCDTTDHVIAMFDERMAGIKFSMLADYVQTNTAAATVYYNSGTTWTTVGTVVDGTLNPSTDALGQTGLLSWNPPDADAEFRKTLFGTSGYAYRIVWDGTLSGTHGDATQELLIDLVTGIPAQNETLPYKFMSTFRNRLLGCGYIAGKEGNRVDYTMTNSSDVWNGYESSMQGAQSLYFGGVEELTCGTEIYNRFGSNIYAIWLALKTGETYILSGSGPEDYQIYPISYTVGCPAPLTLATAETGFEMAKDVTRNVAIWLSYAGPVIFDGAVLKPILGISNYFDPNEPEVINFDKIDIASGWYDPTYREYNLLIPSGSGQTTNNVWLVYDMVRGRWFQKDTGQGERVQVGFPVQDTSGTKYIYGGIDTGKTVRLEYGTSWGGSGITQRVKTGDWWPTESIWDMTRLRRVKVIAKRITEDHTLAVRYYRDTNEAEGSEFTWTDWSGFEWIDTEDFEWKSEQLLTLSLAIDSGVNRLTRVTDPLNLLGWSHGFGFEVTTSDTVKAFQPIGWGVEYQIVRKDL